MLIDPSNRNPPVQGNRFLPVTAVARTRPVQARVPQEEQPEGTAASGDSLEIAPSTMAHLSHGAGSEAAADCPLCQAESRASESGFGSLGATEAEEQAEPIGAEQELEPEERELLVEMQSRDREVRSHEEAHKAAAGNLAAGGPSYETETGPDGNEYAVGGEVQIQLRSGSTPEETIRLAQQARRAALAPAQPSSQDQAVAAEASQREAQARAEAYKETSEEEPGSTLNSLFA